MQEVWRPVVGYEGLYEVSNLGRVRRLPGKTWNGRVWVSREGQLRKLQIAKTGYLAVDLKRAGVRKTFTVHTLVLTAFVGPRPAKYECRHLNGVRTDARLCNLAWGTPRQNDEDRKRHGTFVQGEKHGAAKLTEEEVRQIRSLSCTHQVIAERFNVSQSLVSMIRSRKRWRHVQ